MPERAVGGHAAKDVVLERLHGLGGLVVQMVVPEQMERPVHEQQADLVGEGRAEARRLRLDVGGREHDVAGLAGREVGVVGALALEAHDVRGRVDSAPLAVGRGDVLVGDDRYRDVALALNALMREDGIEERPNLVFGKRELKLLIVGEV